MSGGRQRRIRRTRHDESPNPAGAHALADRAASRLVRDAAIEAADLVLDLGAGLGAVTRPLARTGARIIAVERDERTARRLAARMYEYPRVTVVTGDALSVPLPARPYRVVANIPFAITSPLLRRLISGAARSGGAVRTSGARRARHRSWLTAADLVVERSAGHRLAGPADRPELVHWHRLFAFSLGPVVPARYFRPEPPMDAVVLRLRHR